MVHLADHELTDTKSLSRQRKISLVDEPEMRVFPTDWLKDPSLRIKLSGLDKRKTKHMFSTEIYQPKETTQARSRGSAIARAFSLAMLVGLLAQTNAGIACGRLIVDTGCGKGMVSDKTFTESLLPATSKKRPNPLRTQAANGILTLDKEVTYDIRKFKQVTSAVGQTQA